MDGSREWLDDACGALGIERAQVDEDVLLKLAKVVAHRVERKAAPLSTFLAGVAVGRGEDLDEVVERLRDLTQPEPTETQGLGADGRPPGQDT